VAGGVLTVQRDPRRVLLEAFDAALAAVNGRSRVREWLTAHPVDGAVALLAVGKAACDMARGAQEALGASIQDALIVTKHGHGARLPWPVLEAGHPLPDAKSLAAGEQLAAFVARLPASMRVLVLLSGGASALLERLPAGVTLDDLRRVNEWLLGSGLDIHAMNAVRKRLSLIKGGRLAQQLRPRPVMCLAISDVPGDDPRAIGSGPLTPEPTGLATDRLPAFVRDALAAATPLPAADDPGFGNVEYHIVADNVGARNAAGGAVARRGYHPVIDPVPVSGDAATTGVRLAQLLQEAPPGVVHVWGGETTVTLPAHPGRGGRCQQLALAAARELAGRDDAWLLAAATDGSDGPGDDAGALIDGGTIARGEAEGFDAAAVLARADAGRFLEASGDLLATGPTGTNVMDLVLGLRL
jgi:hydroxypyruvate reductase